MEHVYPELAGFRIRDKKAPPPDFPTHGPACGAGTERPATPGACMRAYACGGKYTEKSQIQGHTFYFYGHCPVVLAQQKPVGLFSKDRS